MWDIYVSSCFIELIFTGNFKCKVSWDQQEYYKHLKKIMQMDIFFFFLNKYLFSKGFSQLQHVRNAFQLCYLADKHAVKS